MKLRALPVILVLFSIYAHSAQTQKNDVTFTRYLDAGGSEGFRLTCGQKSLCSLELTKNGESIKKRQVPLEKVKKFTEQFVSNLELANETVKTTPKAAVLLEWSAALGGKNLKGSIPKNQDASKIAKTVDAVSVLEAQLWLELNQ